MKSKTFIKKQTERKRNPKLVETILSAGKYKEWGEIAKILSSPRRKIISINLDEISSKIKEEKIIVVPGKVLSQGEISKKIKIVALKFSKKAEEKLLKSGCEILSINKEIKNNPEAKGVKILK